MEFTPARNIFKKRMEQIEEFEEETRKDRTAIIELTILKIMRRKKSEKHARLMEDITKKITTFVPLPALIVKRIESLIERGYLTRQFTDLSTYIYVP